MATTKKKSSVGVFKRTYYEDTVVPKSAFFGCVTWEETIRTDKLSEEIIVYSSLPVRVVNIGDKHAFNLKQTTK